MFLRNNAGKEIGFALAQPRETGNLGFPRCETRWPGFFLVWRSDALNRPFFPSKPAKQRLLYG
jgi:hypothetical protein